MWLMKFLFDTANKKITKILHDSLWASLSALWFVFPVKSQDYPQINTGIDENK